MATGGRQLPEKKRTTTKGGGVAAPGVRWTRRARARVRDAAARPTPRAHKAKKGVGGGKGGGTPTTTRSALARARHGAGRVRGGRSERRDERGGGGRTGGDVPRWLARPTRRRASGRAATRAARSRAAAYGGAAHPRSVGWGARHAVTPLGKGTPLAIHTVGGGLQGGPLTLRDIRSCPQIECGSHTLRISLWLKDEAESTAEPIRRPSFNYESRSY